MNQDNTDIQRTKHRDIQKDICEVLVRDDDSIDRNDECLFAKLRNVLQYSAQVGQFQINTWVVGPLRALESKEFTLTQMQFVEIRNCGQGPRAILNF